MDPDQRLIEELQAQLRGSLNQMRLGEVEREQLRELLLSTPVRRRPWLRWAIPGRGWGRAGAVAAAFCALALAISLPLLHASQTPSPTLHTFTAISPPRLGAGAGGAAIPVPACSGKAMLSSSRRQLTLGRRQSAAVVIREVGGACTLTAAVSGPSSAAVTLVGIGTARQNGAAATYQLLWAGHTSGSHPGELAPGQYMVEVRAGTGQHLKISVSVSG
ncbi:MAG: hypothetical protein ACREOD_10165 [Candidatus Dormibacteria bacterium]